MDHVDNVVLFVSASEFVGEGDKGERGRMCVGSFARVNVQHPQAEEAEKKRKAQRRTHGERLGLIILLFLLNGPLL
jgi:hypothetical protein